MRYSQKFGRYHRSVSADDVSEPNKTFTALKKRVEDDLRDFKERFSLRASAASRYEGAGHRDCFPSLYPDEDSPLAFDDIPF